MSDNTFVPTKEPPFPYFPDGDHHLFRFPIRNAQLTMQEEEDDDEDEEEGREEREEQTPN